MYFSSISTIALLAATCVARPTSNVVVEELQSPPVGWVKDESAKVDKDATTITLQIHLANQGMNEFHDLAMNVRSCFIELEDV